MYGMKIDFYIWRVWIKCRSIPNVEVQKKNSIPLKKPKGLVSVNQDDLSNWRLL